MYASSACQKHGSKIIYSTIFKSPDSHCIKKPKDDLEYFVLHIQQNETAMLRYHCHLRTTFLQHQYILPCPEMQINPSSAMLLSQRLQWGCNWAHHTNQKCLQHPRIHSPQNETYNHWHNNWSHIHQIIISVSNSSYLFWCPVHILQLSWYIVLCTAPLT